MDTSPGGDYYTSPSSPTSSNRNWTEDMEGGRAWLCGCRGSEDYQSRAGSALSPGAGARLKVQGLLGVVVRQYVPVA